MNIEDHIMSVPEAAAICGVTRSTVNHWIKTNKLRATRTGRNYSVPARELFLFLKSTGRDIPVELEGIRSSGPVFNTPVPCWNYWKGSEHGNECSRCVVLNHQPEICFTAKESSRLRCTTSCSECGYYEDIFLSRIEFIHQIDSPAAVFKGLFFWGVNSRWAETCGRRVEDFPGSGVEQVIAQESLAAFISAIKKSELGEPVQKAISVCVKNEGLNRLNMKVSFYAMNEPSGAFLVLGRMCA